MDDELFDLLSDDSNWEERPGFYKPVDISIDGNTFVWKPDSDFLFPLEGRLAKEIYENLRGYLEIRSQIGAIYASKEWPSIPASITNLYAVVWAIDALYGDRKISYNGDAPSINDIKGTSRDV